MKRPSRAQPKSLPPLRQEALAAALDRVAADYSEFIAAWSRGDGPPDPKAFAAHQAAARSALAHLVELAGLATGEAPAGNSVEDIAAIVENARKTLAQEDEG